MAKTNITKKVKKMDEGGTTLTARPGYKFVTRKEGGFTVREEVPDFRVQDEVAPLNAGTASTYKPTAIPVPKMSAPKYNDITYETWQAGKNGQQMYSPVFNGKWTPNQIRGIWDQIPEWLNGREVLRGDAWQSIQDSRHRVPQAPQPNYAMFALGGQVYQPGAMYNPMDYMDHAVPNTPSEDPQSASSSSSPMSGGGGFELSTLPLLQGANALASTLYNNNIRKSEARMMRNQLMPVQSATDFKGIGTDIVSMAYGGMVSNPNALVEGGEVMQTPDGVTKNIYGERHNDRPDGMGGTEMNLPDQTRIFSDKLKFGKDVASEIMGKKITRKMTPAQLAKKFDTEKYEQTLLNPSSDSLAKRTASIMKQKNETILNDIFDRQESMKTSSNIRKYAEGGTVNDKPSFGKKLLKGVSNLTEYAPEMFAAAQAMRDYPINAPRFNPAYMSQAPGLDISAQLDRNYSTMRGMNGSSGNASIDAARASQMQANLLDANNQVFAQKYQYDSNRAWQTDYANTQIENQANMTNLQLADKTWDKMTARQASKNMSMQGVINSAYAKNKSMQSEDRSLKLLEEVYPNFRYNPNSDGAAFQVVQRDGQMWVLPNMMGGHQGMIDGDGIRTTTTTKYGNRTVKRTESDRN
jgi:hypothetical protein